MQTFEICTAQIRYGGADRLDITAGKVYAQERRGIDWMQTGEGQLYAPPGWLPAFLKRKRLDEDDYTLYYENLMRDRYASPILRPEFHAMITRRIEQGHNRIVLCCYCRSDAFCHRCLAQTIMYKIACSMALPEVVFVLGDEIEIPHGWGQRDEKELKEELPI